MRVWTIPNLLSAARICAVPLFFWLIIGPHADGKALVVLCISGTTDWVDGFLARRLNQFSRLGELLDPLADRLYTAAALVALTMRDVLPVWVLVALLARDITMSGLLARLRTRGITGVPVNFIGKAATMQLLWAMPLLLLGAGATPLQATAHTFGWAFLLWGIAMYWRSAQLYLRQVLSSGLL